MVDYSSIVKKMPPSLYSGDEGSVMSGIMNIIAGIFTELQEVVVQIEGLRLINRPVEVGAKDVILDEIGKIVGESRKGRTDEEYQLYLYAAIKRNISNGSIDDISDIVSLLLGESGSFTIEEFWYSDNESVRVWLLDATWPLDGNYLLNGTHLWPAKFKLTLPAAIDANTSGLIEDIIGQVRPAGVTMELGFAAAP